MLDDRTVNRYENGKNRLREVSQNHRENYQNFTNSDIFFSKGNPSLNKTKSSNQEPTGSDKKKLNTSFVPKFSEKSALERKFYEFHNADVSTNNDTLVNTSFDFTNIVHKRKASAVELKTDYSTYNPKERRIKELYSTFQTEGIKVQPQLDNNNTSINKRPNDKIDPKKAVVSDMYSNIFNDPDKNQSKFIDQMKVEEKNMIKKEPHVNVPKSKITSNFNWLDENTQLNFKENLKTEIDDSAQKRKLKNIYSSIDSMPKDVSTNLNYKNEIEDKNNSVQTMSELKKILQEKFGNNHKFSKAIETIGRFHDNDFYHNLKIDKSDRAVEVYETVPVKNYNNLDMKEIKRMFIKSGIHLYDLNLEEKVLNGSDYGKIGFKIRKNEDLKDFEKKKKEVFEKLNSIGIHMKEATVKGKRPITSSLPSNIKWINPNVEKYIKNNSNFDSVKMQPKVIPNNEKISKAFPEVNVQYKNTMVTNRKVNSKQTTQSKMGSVKGSLTQR